MAALGSENDEESLKDCISPNADVFSYFTLTAPSERKKHGKFTVDAFLSYLLVFVVLFIQCTLLFCVSHKVIAKNAKWQFGILNTGKDWDIVGLMPGKGCSDGKSLCTSQNGTFTCAPPSLQLIGRWDVLDANKDGTWTRDEAMASREPLRCKYAVDPVEVFDVLIMLLKQREKYIWLHQDVKGSKGIQKVYFTYIMGDIAMCGYRNGDMCGNLVKRGFFDAALIHGTAPRVGTSIRSALDYCHSLLDIGGFCERSLPSTYATWRIKSVQECKDPEYSQFTYQDPGGGGPKSLLEVDYDAREDYEIAQTPVFLIYKTCIIFLWLLLIVSQVRAVFAVVTWVLQIPIKDDASDEDAAKDGTETDWGPKPQAKLNRRRSALRNDEIQSIAWSHRISLILVTFVRISMLLILLYVGLMFLGRQTDYIGLLLDGVALIFIVEVEEILYTRVLRQDVRHEWEEREPIILKKIGFLAHRPDVTDTLWFVAVMLMAIAFLVYYTTFIVSPMYDALQCACLSEGQMCHEAHIFSKDFWDHYWQHDVPDSIEAINIFRTGVVPSDDLANNPGAVKKILGTN